MVTLRPPQTATEGRKARRRARATPRRRIMDAAESIRRRRRRSAQPLNEFTDNATLLYGAFWPLFPLRAGLRGDGPLTPASRRHLLTQFHNAFAHSPQLIFLLADQVQRHAAARGVALRVKADTDSFNTFAATVANEGSFLERLEAAKNDPLSKESRELLKHVSRFVVSSGKAIPWSAEERAGEITRLYAMWRRFGPPSAFITAAPDDVHQPTCLRLAFRCFSACSFPAVDDGLLAVLQGVASIDSVREFLNKVAATQPAQTCEFSLDEKVLQWLATQNPVATTLFYEQLMDAVFSVIMGVPPSHRRRKSIPVQRRTRGGFGKGVAWCLIHETNGRKSLHGHASFHGGCATALLANVVGIAELEAAVAAALDSVYRACVPLDVHALDAARRSLKVVAVKHTYSSHPAPPCDEESLRAFQCEASFRGIQLGFHTHAQTCHKGKAGKWGCRMARPAGHPVPQTRALALTSPSSAAVAADGQDGDPEMVQWRCPECDAAPRDESDPRHIAVLQRGLWGRYNTDFAKT